MWYNGIMRWLLSSPLHVAISKSIMLMTYRGRRSGKIYRTPVNYVCEGEAFIVVSDHARVWWRNFRDGADATLRVQGQDIEVRGDVVEDDESVSEGLMRYLQNTPQNARYFGVSLDAQGQPNAEDVARVARTRVVVRFHRI